jgi:hypothetical protein
MKHLTIELKPLTDIEPIEESDDYLTWLKQEAELDHDLSCYEQGLETF